MNDIAIIFLFSFLGFILGILLIFIINYLKGNILLNKANQILETAKKDADALRLTTIKEGKMEIEEIKKKEFEEIVLKKDELKETKENLLVRESNLDRRDELVTKREELLDTKENNILKRQNNIQVLENEIEEIKKEELQKLEKIALLSKEEARVIVLDRVKEMIDREIADYLKERESEARLIADKNAKSLLIESMEKYANDVVSEQTISVVDLPNDDMKGRIIGREGRNIRAIEAVTGVDLIIDDTPDVIVLSCFDPKRREIARITLENLIKDGRIHPSRIEELYEKATEEVTLKIREYGEAAVYELGLSKIDPELIELIGTLYLRTSYGQNCLQHSIEVAHFAGLMAASLGENITLAKRAGLLHDIGKAIDFEIEGSHVEIGMDIARKYNEVDEVINGIAYHHGDYDATSVISVLVKIGDVLSAARPGARNASVENYINRLAKLEEVAISFDGVKQAYAISAGREVRVIVKPDEIDDVMSHKIAHDIKSKIEKEMQYPGIIKVTVIRETRVVEEAK